MAVTQAQVDALRAARFAGIRSVRWGDREVTYASIEELTAVLAAAEAELLAASGTPPVRRLVLRNDRGYAA